MQRLAHPMAIAISELEAVRRSCRQLAQRAEHEAPAYADEFRQIADTLEGLREQMHGLRDRVQREGG